MGPGMLSEMREMLANRGVSIPAGSIPKGITRDNNGDAVLYYAGSDLLPKYLMEIDSLLGEPFLDLFEERKPNTEYFKSFDWDNGTETGWVDLRRPDGEMVRHYFTTHQPTSLSTLPEGADEKKWWFRKIYATLPNGVQVKVWEKFERTESNMQTGY